jgi:hypothetical protein
MAQEQLTLAQAARELGITHDSLRTTVNKRRIAATKQEHPRGAYWTIAREEVERYRREQLGKPGGRSRYAGKGE